LLIYYCKESGKEVEVKGDETIEEKTINASVADVYITKDERLLHELDRRAREADNPLYKVISFRVEFIPNFRQAYPEIKVREIKINTREAEVVAVTKKFPTYKKWRFKDGEILNELFERYVSQPEEYPDGRWWGH